MYTTSLDRAEAEMNRKAHEAVLACGREHRERWVVLQRNGNCSAFNGYHWTPSDYSSVMCAKPGGCGRVWRTNAAYVDRLPDAPPK
jgi:hypothetical protein